MFTRLKYLIMFFRGCNKYYSRGENNKIQLGENCKFRKCCIDVRGSNNEINIGDNCSFKGMQIVIYGNGNTIDFGNDVKVNASAIKPTSLYAAGGTSISIGTGCLLSNNIEVHTTDHHGIYDLTGKRINNDKSIVIGKYVWIGLGCKILKGTTIPDGSVVGAGSVVCGKYLEENVVLAGNPASVVRTHIFWKLDCRESYSIPNVLLEKWSS